MTFPKLAAYAYVAGDGRPYVLPDGTLDLPALERLARCDYVVLDASPCTFHRPDILRTLRAFHPGIRLLAFVVASGLWKNPNAPGDPATNWPWQVYQAIDAIGGWAPYAANTVDLTNPTAREAYVLTLKRLVLSREHWDGLFVDSLFSHLWWVTDRAEYNPRAWSAGCDALCQMIRIESPDPFVLVANGGDSRPAYFDGAMHENFPHQWDQTWAGNMHGDDTRGAGYFHDRLGWLSSIASADAAENARRIRFGLGSACLGEGVHVVVPEHAVPGHSVAIRGFTNDWVREYCVHPRTGCSTTDLRWKGWLGRGLGPAFEWQGAWRRDFDNGLVLVNPSERPWAGDFSHSPLALHRIDGSAKVGVATVPPQDALFLARPA